MIDARQEAGAPVLRVALGQAAAERVVHHDERRQILALAPKAIGHPGAGAGKAHAREAGVDLHQGRRVIVRIGPARMDERHFIDMASEIREDFGDVFAALSVRPKAKRRAHDRPDLIAEKPGVAVEAGQLLAVAPFQLGLVIPGIDLARPAVDEQPDDVLGLGRMMARRAAERGGSEPVRVPSCVWRPSQAWDGLLGEQVPGCWRRLAKAEHAEAAADARQELAARVVGGMRGGEEFGDVVRERLSTEVPLPGRRSLSCVCGRACCWGGSDFTRSPGIR